MQPRASMPCTLDPARAAPLRLLLVEDSPDDADLLLRALARGGLTVIADRAEDRAELERRLATGTYDLVISDYSLPTFSAREALETLQASQVDVPFMVVSGTIGELAAVELMRAGARDYLLKDDLARLVPAVQRELAESAQRRAHAAADAELRRSEAARQRTARMLAESQAAAHVGGWEYDIRASALYWTDELYRIHETTPDAFTPTLVDVMRFVAERDQARVAEAQVAAHASAQRWDLEYEGVTARGRPFWARIVGDAVIEDGVVVRVFGAILDITQRRQLEAQLMLNDRLATMGTLAAGVAHEINNPLTFLVGNLPLALETARGVADGAAREQLVPLLQDCQQGAERIAAIVRDLRVFSRPHDASPSAIALRPVIDSVLRMVANESAQRAAMLIVDVETLPDVVGVESRIAQVLTNLMVNSLQAFPSGSEHHNTITVQGRVDGEYVRLEVRDNGPGIPDSVRARVFEPFFTTKSAGVGTGLGLSVCQRVVESVGGRIELESTPGLGTTVRVYLRIAGEDVLHAQRVTSLLPPSLKPGKARVLVVDDEPMVLRVIERALREFHVETADGGQAALDRLASGATFDAVLCDLMMPGMSGSELYAELLVRHPDVAGRSLFLTGAAFTDATRSFLDGLPAERLVAKPFHPKQLAARVRALVGA